jgi:hypothetical protein
MRGAMRESLVRTRQGEVAHARRGDPERHGVGPSQKFRWQRWLTRIGPNTGHQADVSKRRSVPPSAEALPRGPVDEVEDQARQTPTRKLKRILGARQGAGGIGQARIGHAWSVSQPGSLSRCRTCRPLLTACAAWAIALVSMPWWR